MSDVVDVAITMLVLTKADVGLAVMLYSDSAVIIGYSSTSIVIESSTKLVDTAVTVIFVDVPGYECFTIET